MRKHKQLMTMITVIAMVLLIGVTAYAAGDVNLDGDKLEAQEGQRRMGKRIGGFRILEEAIEAGIITQTEADEIEAHKEANKPDMDAVRAATEGMTREEAKAYMEETYGPRPEPFAGLVEAGILTQEQVDALLELVPLNPGQGEGFEGERKSGGRGHNNGQGHQQKGPGGIRQGGENEGTNSL